VLLNSVNPKKENVKELMEKFANAMLLVKHVLPKEFITAHLVQKTQLYNQMAHAKQTLDFS